MSTRRQPPADAPPGSPAAEKLDEAARRSFLRRLMALLLTGGTAFALATWTLVHLENPPGLSGSSTEPGEVVKAHLDALNRGEVRAAYELFSERYREQVPFEEYRELVVTHWGMFRTHELRISHRETEGVRAVVETHMLGESGERYLARFTLVRAAGHWSIDDLRWRAQSASQGLLTV
jgi:Domain of unknown function (DUF4864)